MNIERYIPPQNHRLHPYLDSIWRVESRTSFVYETVLPKQIVDLLFNLGAPRHTVHTVRTEGADLTRFHLAGPQTGAFTTRVGDTTILLGVSLKCDGCSALLPVPLNELTDYTVEGSLIFPQQRFLWEKVAEAQTFTAQCAILLDWLLSLLRPQPHLELVQHACRSLRESPTEGTLDRLSSELHISTRHLRRLMLRHVGVGPAQYIRLSRFAKSLYLMHEPASLTEIAHSVHYSDQAHFARDFKEIAAMTPSDYRGRMSPYSRA